MKRTTVLVSLKQTNPAMSYTIKAMTALALSLQLLFNHRVHLGESNIVIDLLEVLVQPRVLRAPGMLEPVRVVAELAMLSVLVVLFVLGPPPVAHDLSMDLRVGNVVFGSARRSTFRAYVLSQVLGLASPDIGRCDPVRLIFVADVYHIVLMILGPLQDILRPLQDLLQARKIAQICIVSRVICALLVCAAMMIVMLFTVLVGPDLMHRRFAGGVINAFAVKIRVDGRAFAGLVPVGVGLSVMVGWSVMGSARRVGLTLAPTPTLKRPA